MMCIRKLTAFFNDAILFPTLITIEARREYLTKRVMSLITGTLGIFLGLISILWLFGVVDTSPFQFLIPLFIIAVVSRQIAMNGHWRWVTRVPTIMFIAIGLLGSIAGYNNNFIVFYVLGFILSGILVNLIEMVITLILTLIMHYGISLFILHISFNSMLPSIITITGVFIGIGLLQWVSISIVNQTLERSTRDPLTGLFNRGFFDAEIEHLQNRWQYPVTILVMDLNGLKTVNDHYGHKAGDLLLIRTAKIIQTSFRREDINCRIGGDEFVTFLLGADESVIDKILKRLNLAIEYDNLQNPDQILSLAIGTASGSKGSRLQDVFNLADSRMYDQKERYKKNKA